MHSAVSAPILARQIVLVLGLASTWLLFPLVIGPLALLREFWSWAMVLVLAWVGTGTPNARTRVVHTLAWSLLLAGAVNATAALVQAYDVWQHQAQQDVYGFLHQRNQLATLCLMGVAACAWLQTEWASSRAGRSGAAALALVFGAVCSLSASRTGLVGLALGWGVAEALAYGAAAGSARRALRTCTRLALAGYVLAMAPAVLTSTTQAVGIWARQEAQEGLSVCSSRLSLWANVLELIALRPWAGWGWGELDYAHVTTALQTPRFCALLSNAHNLPLHIAVELGVPVALAASSALLWGLLRARPWREHQADRLLAWALLWAVGLHSLLEYPLWYGPFQASTLIALWLLWRAPTPGHSPSASRLGTSLVLRSGVVTLMLILSVVTVDYVRASQIYLGPDHRVPAWRNHTQESIRHALFFQDLIDFADLGMTAVTPENAQAMHDLALRMLHFSPEAMVLQKLLDSSRLLGLEALHTAYQRQFAAAYPEAFLDWKARQGTQGAVPETH